MSVVERPVEQQRGVRDHRLEPLGVAAQVLDDLLDRDRAAVVDLGQQVVLDLERGLDLLAQDRLVEDVGDPDADPVDLVGVRRTDAAARRTDLVLAQEPLGDLVDRGVVRRDHVGVGADHEPAHRHVALDHRVELAEQRLGRDHDPVGDHRGAVGRQDPARQQVGGELLAVDDDRVAGVVAAARADAEVDRVLGGEQVGRLALALVAPLGSEHDDSGHVQPSISGCRFRTGPRPEDESPVQQHRALATTRYQGRRRTSIRRRRAARAGPSRVSAWIPLLLITNADAGGGERDALDVALGVLREDADVEVATHQQPRRARRRAAPRRLPLASWSPGGDGSLHAVVAALHRRHELAERTLGLIPLGTGNDFARTLEHPARPGRGGRRAARRRSRAGWT